VPPDTRVWLEARTLAEAGYHVSVISPKGKGWTRSIELIDGVGVFRYEPAPDTGTVSSFFLEYARSFAATTWLALKVLFTEGFDVLHVCNPPEVFFPLAWILKPLGVKFVFDHHDLSPEMYLAKFGTDRNGLYRALLLLERLTYAASDYSIATNDSYREIAVARGGMDPARVAVVRTGVDTRRLNPTEPDERLKRGRRFLVCYLGEMCRQDGVDYLVKAAHLIRRKMHRRDIAFTLLGAGPAMPELAALTERLGLSDDVHFTGFVDDAAVCRHLSTADVCVVPDPKTEWADKSTMNKVAEYMAFGKPMVAFDLCETRRTARDAALYVEEVSPRALAEGIVLLLENPDLRSKMGHIGYDRARRVLSWDVGKEVLLDLYARVFGKEERKGSLSGGLR